MEPVYIVSAVRTPIGSFLGQLSALPAPRLGALAISEAVQRAGIEPQLVDQVIMGNVLQAGVGQAPARQAMRFAGLPDSVPAVTLHKVCGSGMRAVMMAANDLRAGDGAIMVAGGMESMSNAPYLLPGGRKGYRLGHGQVLDHMVFDGLWDPYGDKHMGNCAELCAREYGFSREEQDAFARASYERAIRATEQGDFAEEIVPVEVSAGKGQTTVVSRDEEPFRADLSKMPSLKPAFEQGGTVTAANASKINDGAAALVLATETAVKAHNLKPLARVVAHASFAQHPEWFTTAPVGAIRKVLERAHLRLEDIDLFEVNEAFAVVAMATMRELAIPHEKLNVNGGAVALGHPIGASGARILTTLLYALRRRGLKLGLAAICIGGGEATAMIVENLA
ncbi:MAG: thiolase family protein [Acidobacteriota bacterium]|uniref:Acetyl-CoA acetyltransferase n=1 Tax=Thermoanaerobaculum aquaticum TaxID=1312852 RepID=A0A062XQQ7_9BACT|nr:thiolase family protein [Thermoanaerobaculum aquaticum]KDA53153.1 acetyl-CoA acetyltransferase [Thermoanaerobaculum aquaticum]BCW92768.1 MAG: acetyl-CoA acetyltransferase [Thermoanaerobaculum sp.]